MATGRGLRGRTDGRRSGGRHGRQAASAEPPEYRARAAAYKPKSRGHARGVAYEDGRTGVQAIPPQIGLTLVYNMFTRESKSIRGL